MLAIARGNGWGLIEVSFNGQELIVEETKVSSGDPSRIAIKWRAPVVGRV